MRTLAILLLGLALAGCTGQQGAVTEPPTQPTTKAPPAVDGGGTASPGTTPTPPEDAPPAPPTRTEPQPGSVRQQNVTVRGAAFLPADITVVPGSTVTWTNEDGVAHEILLDDGSGARRGPFAEGQQAALTFGEAGTFPYRCPLHPAMTGVVRVEVLAPTPSPPAPSGAFNVTLGGRAYSPGVLTAAVGSVVTWTNADHEPHEVEADAGGLFASPILLQGDAFTVTLTRAGTFTYHCDFHQMKGTLIVE